MCKYCSGKKELDSDWLCLSIYGNKLELHYNAYSSDSSFDEQIPIKYCPMCGKKLVRQLTAEGDNEQ